MTLTDLYEEYESYLRSYAVHLGHDTLRADDLVQETFIRAMGHLALLQVLKPHQRRAWLSRTLKNLFLDEQKRRQQQEILIDPLTWENPEASYLIREDIGPNPFDLVPEQYRDLFQKQYILGMTSQEIAAELGIPAATVRSRLHLAMKALRSQKSKLA